MWTLGIRIITICSIELQFGFRTHRLQRCVQPQTLETRLTALTAKSCAPIPGVFTSIYGCEWLLLIDKQNRWNRKLLFQCKHWSCFSRIVPSTPNALSPSIHFYFTKLIDKLLYLFISHILFYVHYIFFNKWIKNGFQSTEFTTVWYNEQSNFKIWWKLFTM